MKPNYIETASMSPLYKTPESEELWAKIPDFDTYSVSNQGRVRNDVTMKILKPNAGYNNSDSLFYLVVLMKDKRKYTKCVSRLVAEAFVERPANVIFRDVNFKDGNPHNLAADNLKWVPKITSPNQDTDSPATARKRTIRYLMKRYNEFLHENLPSDVIDLDLNDFMGYDPNLTN